MSHNIPKNGYDLFLQLGAPSAELAGANAPASQTQMAISGLESKTRNWPFVSQEYPNPSPSAESSFFLGLRGSPRVRIWNVCSCMIHSSKTSTLVVQ